jgi:glycosyltransferase involved in cell wall biosynthesis
MKKIVQIGPDKSLKGGIATVISNIENSCISKDYILSNISTYSNNRLLEFIKACFKIVTLKCGEDDILHFHMASYGSFFRKYILFQLAPKKCIKIIHIHGGGFEEFYKKSNHLVKKMIKDMLNKSDKILTVSKSLFNTVSSVIGIKEDKISVLYNGIEINNEETDVLKENIILFMGKLVDYKGIYDFIQAISLIKNEIGDYEVLIAGDGDIDNFNKLLKEHGLEKQSKMLGWVSGEHKKALLRKAKLFVAPSYSESFGISIVEAMNNEIAVIATNIGGIPEIITNGIDGILINPGDIDKLSQVITHMINNENHREKLAQEALKTSKKFSIDQSMHNLNMIYKELNRNEQNNKH